MSSRSGAPAGPSSLLQGIALLADVVDHERSGRAGHTASRLAERTGIERSRTSRLTQELVELGYLTRDANGVFAAGAAYLGLGRAFQGEWLRAARFELRRIAARFPAVARVSAPAGSAFSVLLRFEVGAGAPDSATSPGMVVPVWCTGSGRALLWDATEDEVRDRLAEVGFVGVGGPRAARSPAEVWEALQRDRARGHVEAVAEFEHGITELAVPIRSGTRVIASLGAACRGDAGGVGALPEALERAAERLSALIR